MALRHGNTFYYRDVEFQLDPLFGSGVAVGEDTQANLLTDSPTGGELSLDSDQNKTLWIGDATDSNYHMLYSVPCYSKNFSGTLSINDSTLTSIDLTTSPTYRHKITVANTSELTANPVHGQIYYSFWVEFAANTTGIRYILVDGLTSNNVIASQARNANASGTTSVNLCGTTQGPFDNTPLEFKVFQSSGGALNVINYRIAVWQRGHPEGMLDQ
jgi:hypothetical protein